MPLGRQASAANMQCPFVQNEPIGVGEKPHEIRRKLGQYLHILDAVASPSDASNAHDELWRTTRITDRRRE
jgi:hypothetical protein